MLATWTASDNENHEQTEPETLLDTTSELNRPDKNRRTALHWAAARPGAGEIIRLLISLGADKRRKDKLGMSPLMQVVESKAMEDTIRLLASGTDLEVKINKENTALLLAVKKSNLKSIEVLLDLGADVQTVNLYGKTALHEAVGISNDGMVKLLLQNRAKPNRKDDQGSTPLMLAARRGEPSIINSARLEVPNPRGKTALLHAVETNQLKCLQVLLDNGGKVRLYTQDSDTALHIAINEGNAELLWSLLDRGADLEATDASGRTPQLAAVLKGQLTIMNILGSNRDARFGPHPGQSPLEIVRGGIKKLSEMPKGKSRFQQLQLLEQMESSLSQPPNPAPIVDSPRRLMAQPPPESPYALESCRGFQGLVVDFLPGRLKKNLEGRISVMNLLYGGGPEEAIRPLRLFGMKSEYMFRWHHLPANNVSSVPSLVCSLNTDHEYSYHGSRSASMRHVNQILLSLTIYLGPNDKDVP